MFDRAYIMFTSTVRRFYGSTLMFMQRHNEVQCQCHDTGIGAHSRVGGRGQDVFEGILWVAYEQTDLCFMKNISENISHN